MRFNAQGLGNHVSELLTAYSDQIMKAASHLVPMGSALALYTALLLLCNACHNQNWFFILPLEEKKSERKVGNL